MSSIVTLPLSSFWWRFLPSAGSALAPHRWAAGSHRCSCRERSWPPEWRCLGRTPESVSKTVAPTVWNDDKKKKKKIVRGIVSFYKIRCWNENLFVVEVPCTLFHVVFLIWKIPLSFGIEIWKLSWRLKIFELIFPLCQHKTFKTQLSFLGWIPPFINQNIQILPTVFCHIRDSVWLKFWTAKSFSNS